MTKVSQSLTDRIDRDGIAPLFNHDTGEVIGTFYRGKITYFKNNSSTNSLAATVSKPNRLTREKSLTELLGAPL